MRLGILTSHPIQYQAPWFRALAKETDLHVFFAHRQSAVEQGKSGFGVAFDWDVDLLSGYAHTFLKNKSSHPGVNHFFGCDTPEIAEIIRAGGQPPARQSGYGGGARTKDGGQTKFDAFIVCGWNLKSYWQAIRACRRAGVPVLVRGDSQLDTTRSFLKRGLKQLTHRFALRQFDGFLSVGQRNREYLRHYGVPADRIFFAPHFVDNDRFAAQAAKLRGQKSEVRSQWSIPEESFCVLFCGKFIPKKRPLDLVKAAELLITKSPTVIDRRYSAVHLLFVGSGELGQQLRASCNVVFDQEGFGLTSDLRPLTSGTKPPASFAGFLNQTQVSKAYVAADCLVLPSDGRETWGLVVNEAMACGLPAIVSDAIGCAPDLIEEGETGFTFPLGSGAALAERLATLLQMQRVGHDFAPALAAKMRAYNVETAASGTLRAVENLMGSEV